MAMKIDANVCTACGDCEPVCPTQAIYPHKGLFAIHEDKCTECEGDHDMPQCVDVCMEPDCILPV